MGLLRLTLATCILLISGPAFAQSWIEYTSRQDLFSINFPGEPTVEDTTYTSQYEAEYPARVYTRHNGESRYSITVVDHTDAERIFKERGPLGAHSECRNRCWIVDLYSAPNHAANEFLTRVIIYLPNLAPADRLARGGKTASYRTRQARAARSGLA